MAPFVKFVRTPQGFQSFVSKSGEALTPWKQYKQSEVGSALAKAKASGWNVNYSEPALELGNPMLHTTWGNIPTWKRGKLIPRWADYFQADLDNPRHFAPPPAANQYINLEDALSTIDDIQKSQIALLGKDKSGGMEMGSYELMLRQDKQPKDFFTGLGGRSQLIRDKNRTQDFARQELGEQVSSYIVPPRQIVVDSTDPKFQGVLGYLQQEGHLDKYRAYNNLGSSGVRKTYDRQGNLVETQTFTPQSGWSDQTPRQIVFNTDGTAPPGISSFESETDSLSHVPQSVYSNLAPRNIVRLPTYPEAKIQPIGNQAYPDQLTAYKQNFNSKGKLKSWYDREAVFRHLQKTDSGFSLRHRGMPTLPSGDSRVVAARVNDNAPYLDWQQEQSGLIQQRGGSYNLVVDPNGYRQRVIDEGLFPTQPKKAIKGLYKDGLPWQPTLVDVNGFRLPPDLELEVEGMGFFPITRGARIGKIPLSSTEPPQALDPNGKLVMRRGDNVKNYSLQAESLIRDPNEPIMMDAFDAIKEKERLTDIAASRYMSARNNPEIPGSQVLALQQEFEAHRQQLVTAQRAYAGLSRIEPVTDVQNVSLSFEGTNADDALALIQKAGLNIDNAYSNLSDRTTYLTASGSLPIRQHMDLASGLGDTYNRQELVLPRGVSIASDLAVFKNAGIAPNALVRGVKWGKNKKGDRVPITPGTPLDSTWDGQRIRVGRVKEPTVQSIAVSSNPVYESDPEWKQLLQTRDAAKRQQREDLVRAVNVKRLERGEPLLVMDEWGYLSHRDPDHSISSLDSNQIQNIIDDARRGTNLETYAATSLGEALDNAALSRSAQNIILSQGNSPSLGMDKPSRYSTSNIMPPIKSRILSTGHAEPSIAELEAIASGRVSANSTPQNKTTTSKSKWGSVGNQPVLGGTDVSWDTARPSLEQKIWEARNVAAIRSLANPRMAAAASKWGQSQPTSVPYGINATVDPEAIYAQRPLLYEALGVGRDTRPPASFEEMVNTQSPVRALPPATVIRPATVDLNSQAATQRTVRFTPVNGGYQTYIDNNGVPTPHKFVTPQDYNAAVQSAAGKGWNVVVDEPAIDVMASRVPDPIFREIPIEGPDTTWVPPRQSTPTPTPRPIVEDPANNWNKYVPYAAAVGGLGIGAAAMYAVNRQLSQEEEDMRQQLAQQQMMMQMQGRRFS